MRTRIRCSAPTLRYDILLATGDDGPTSKRARQAPSSVGRAPRQHRTMPILQRDLLRTIHSNSWHALIAVAAI
eukprot:504624-Alexandrium_andersonii.AAC.1